MKSLQTFVDAWMDYESAEKDFRKEICEIIDTTDSHIKNVYLRNTQDGNKICQYVVLELRGKVELKSAAIAKMGNCKVITPNLIEIQVGEIHL